MYYEESELLEALNKAKKELTRRTNEIKSYNRGYNDCAAFLVLYDQYLKIESKAEEALTFHWNSVKEFIKGLKQKGFTVSQYFEYCGYELVTNKRPKLGDVAFENGAMISDGSFWVSTDETNLGIKLRRQMMFVERHCIIARPIRG